MSAFKSLRWFWMNQKNVVNRSSMVNMLLLSRGILSNSSTGIHHHQKTFGQHQNNSRKKQKFQKRPDLLSQIHKSLLKDVDLPPPAQGGICINGIHLQSCPTESLLPMVWQVTRMDGTSKLLMIELWRRMDSMDFEQIVSIADIFFVNNVRADWYLSSVTAYFLEIMDIVELTPSQLTRFVFHTLNYHRVTPPAFVLALEDVITRSMDSLSLNQLAIICRSFFTSQTRFHSMDLLDKISIKLIEEFDSLSDHYLPLFMKTMRYSNFVKVSFYKDLGNILVEKNFLKNFRTLGQIMHIAHGYASVRVSHPVLFSYILNNCCHPKYKLRLKDLAKLIWSCGTLVTDKPQDISAIKKIITYLEYNVSLEKTLDHPDNLVDLVNGLCFLNLLSDFLLGTLFDSDSISRIIEMAKTAESKLPQLSIINNSVDIEYPSYTGNRLNKKSKQRIASLLGDFSVESEISLKKGMREAIAALQQVLGEDKVFCTRILPHLWTADICLVWDTAESKFRSYKEEVDLPSNQGNTHCIKLAVQVLSHMQTTYDGEPLGMLHMKLRQLKTLGYVPVLIDADDAHRFVYGSVQTTQDFLLKSISRVIETDLTHIFP